MIKGWDLGVKGMKVGGKRKLTIPPELGYGDQGTGSIIPPGAKLVFEIDLLSVEDFNQRIATVAQLVEQLLRKQLVRSSSLLGGSNIAVFYILIIPFCSPGTIDFSQISYSCDS